MSANQTRDRPGLFLLIFACALLLTAVGGWQLHRDARGLTKATALTGAGDARFYTSLSEDDFHNAALVFSHAPQGLVRRTVEPLHREDATMFRVETESTGRLAVYTDSRPEPDLQGDAPPRWYLKAGNDLYVEFGRPGADPPAPAPKGR